MGIERAPIGRAFQHKLEGSPELIREAARILLELGEGSFAITDGQTKIWMSATARRNLASEMRRRGMG